MVPRFEVVDVAVAVDDFVGGKGLHAQIMLDGTLLVGRQVVVDAVFARQVVFLDDVFPRFFAAAVGEVEIHDVVVFQLFVHLLAV